MSDRIAKEHLHRQHFPASLKEMANPRLAASLREGIEKALVAAHAKFRVGLLLHNRNIRDDGFVMKVHQLAECGDLMYAVAVRVQADTWAGGHYVSDWAESTLESSDKAILKHSDKARRLRLQ